MAVVYDIALLKRALALNLSPAATDAHMMAAANSMSARDIRRLPLAQYRAMQVEFARATEPLTYSRRPLDNGRVLVSECVCECECGECGLERRCVPCGCDGRAIGDLPEELTAGHIIDADGDAVKLTEALAGKRCDAMTVSDFRTLQAAIMAYLGTGPLPLAEP